MLGIKVDFKKEYDISVLATQMGVPEEGASAGITILTALVSALLKKPVRHDIAMTGEITLKGKIAAVAGIQEKLVAAAETGIRKVYIPKENRREYESLPQKIKDSLEVQLVESVKEVLGDAILEYDTKAMFKQD
jgi:ATP-dependent Lon protease